MAPSTDKIPLSVIALHIGLRNKRVQEKVNRLNLPVHNGFLTKAAAAELVAAYVHSNKVSADTKERAITLLDSIQNGTVNVPEKPKKTKPRRNRTKLLGSTSAVNNTYVQKPIPVYQAVKSTLNETVQLGVQAMESTHFKFVALLIAIGVQMQHSAEWYGRIVPDGQNSVYAAYGYAFMVDLFILVVTMEGKVNIAKTFAGLTFLANILYFQFWVNFDGSNQAYTNAISSILISGIIAYIIYAYSELFVKYRNANPTK